MKKLFSLLSKLSSPKIPVRADLQAHFWCGLILGIGFNVVIGSWSIVAVALIALLKEVYDYKHPNHTADVLDWVATVLGGVVGLILGEVLWQVIHK
jgi:hypothetical protein